MSAHRKLAKDAEPASPKVLNCPFVDETMVKDGRWRECKIITTGYDEAQKLGAAAAAVCVAAAQPRAIAGRPGE